MGSVCAVPVAVDLGDVVVVDEALVELKAVVVVETLVVVAEIVIEGLMVVYRRRSLLAALTENLRWVVQKRHTLEGLLLVVVDFAVVDETGAAPI